MNDARWHRLWEVTRVIETLGYIAIGIVIGALTFHLFLRRAVSNIIKRRL